MAVKPKTEYRVEIDMPKKTIVIELDKFSFGKYLFKVSHVAKDGKSKPAIRWYNYGEQPQKYDKYFEEVIDKFNRREKDRIIEDLKNDIRRIYQRQWDFKHYPESTQEKINEYNRLIHYLSTL